jgi:hypothetical protein
MEERPKALQLADDLRERGLDPGCSVRYLAARELRTLYYERKMLGESADYNARLFAWATRRIEADEALMRRAAEALEGLTLNPENHPLVDELRQRLDPRQVIGANVISA